jgi:hypothetical protein
MLPFPPSRPDGTLNNRSLEDRSPTIANLTATIGRKSDLTLEGGEVRRMVSPIVYVWARDGHALYCGQSACGLSRPLTRHHHRLRDIQPGDTLLVWMQPSDEDSRRLEARLIRRFAPPLNKGIPPGDIALGTYQPSPSAIARSKPLRALVERREAIETQMAAVQARVAELKAEALDVRNQLAAHRRRLREARSVQKPTAAIGRILTWPR